MLSHVQGLSIFAAVQFPKVSISYILQTGKLFQVVLSCKDKVISEIFALSLSELGKATDIFRTKIVLTFLMKMRILL
jgi:hypothetical protein